METFETKLVPMTTPAGASEEAGVAVVRVVDAGAADDDGAPDTEVMGTEGATELLDV